MTAPRTLVTGAAGFIGGHLLGALGAAGHSVRAAVHDAPTKAEVEQVRIDLSREEELDSVVAGCEFVVHAAAALDPTPSEKLADVVNHRATVRLARASERAGVRCFVFLSSMAALGFHPGAGLVRASAQARPTTAYGRSKRRAELALDALDTGMRIVSMRPPTVYGAGERRNFLALTRAIDTGLFLIPGRGGNRMSFCYIDTLTDAVLWALESDRVRSIVHVSDPPITLRTAVETIADVLGRRLPPVPFPLPVARAVAMAMELAFRPFGKPPPLSRERLRTLSSDVALDIAETARLGFESRAEFRASVAHTVAWYRAEGLLRRNPSL